MWNYRVLAKEYDDVNKTVELSIHEVFYDKEGVPNGYLENTSVYNAEGLKTLNWTLNKMKIALKKPIISMNEFPKEIELLHKCSECENMFDKPTKHKCRNNYYILMIKKQ